MLGLDCQFVKDLGKVAQTKDRNIRTPIPFPTREDPYSGWKCRRLGGTALLNGRMARGARGGILLVRKILVRANYPASYARKDSTSVLTLQFPPAKRTRQGLASESAPVPMPMDHKILYLGAQLRLARFASPERCRQW